MISSEVIRKFPPWTQPKLGITEGLLFCFQSSTTNGTFPLGLIPGKDIPRPSGKKESFLVPHLAQAPGALGMDNFSQLFYSQIPGVVEGHFTIQGGIPEAPEQLQGRGG